MGGEVEAIEVAVGVDKHQQQAYIVWVGRSEVNAPAR
jgi:hypothetical protein